MNKKTILSLIGIIVLAFAAFLFFDSFPKNESASKLIASGHPAWPPIMYQQNDQIIGAGPEIVQKIFSDLGIESEFKYMGSWETVQGQAKSGAVDVLVAAYKTVDRQSYLDYSDPYTVDPIVLVVKKGKSFPYEKWEDLISKRGVVTIGDSYGQDFDNFIKEKLSPKTVETPAEAFALLEKEEVDYFVYALYSAEDYIFNNKISDQVEIISKYISTENFYLTISKKSPFLNLLPQVNALIEKYKNDGTIDQIIKKHKESLWNVIATEPIKGAQVANPASVNCLELGGNLVIEKRGDDGAYGLCYFEDNRACEEWALMRGDCPQGGVKTTGFDTIDQKYCAWSGGQTIAEPQSVCTFKDGSSCPTIEFFQKGCASL